MKKITYKEFVLDAEYNKTISIEGTELKAINDLAVDYSWKTFVDYYTRLYNDGLVDRVCVDDYTDHVDLIIVSDIDDGGQYHRVYTKWF